MTMAMLVAMVCCHGSAAAPIAVSSEVGLISALSAPSGGTLDIQVTASFTLTGGAVAIPSSSGHVTITGAAGTVISCGSTGGAFTAIGPLALTLSQLTISGCSSTAISTTEPVQLTLTGVTIVGSKVSNQAAALSMFGGSLSASELLLVGHTATGPGGSVLSLTGAELAMSVATVSHNNVDVLFDVQSTALPPANVTVNTTTAAFFSNPVPFIGRDESGQQPVVSLQRVNIVGNTASVALLKVANVNVAVDGCLFSNNTGVAPNVTAIDAVACTLDVVHTFLVQNQFPSGILVRFANNTGAFSLRGSTVDDNVVSTVLELHGHTR